MQNHGFTPKDNEDIGAWLERGTNGVGKPRPRAIYRTFMNLPSIIFLHLRNGYDLFQDPLLHALTNARWMDSEPICNDDIDAQGAR